MKFIKLPNNHSQAMPILALVIAMFLWASSFIGLKIAFKSYDPFFIIFGRMIVATLCFAFFIKKFKKVSYIKGTLKYLLFMIFCEPCLYFLFEIKAIENTTASQAGIVTSMLPIMVAIGAWLFFKENLSIKIICGFIIALLGVCILSFSNTPSYNAPNPILGNFLEFMAMVCATGYTLSLKHLTSLYPPFFLTALQAIGGAIFFIPFIFLPYTRIPTHFEPVPAIVIIYLGLFVTLGAYSLYNYSLSKIPATHASAFVNLIPVFTIFLGWIILEEQLNFIQYIASLLIITGVFLSQGKIRKPCAVHSISQSY